MLEIMSIREHPEYLERSADYFYSKWGDDKTFTRALYHDSILSGITTDSPLPRWYLMLKEERIVGCFGLIDNDFIDRVDLKPWLCALYVEKSERGQKLGAKLLEHARREAAKLGFSSVYLCTDHDGYYEKYSWTRIEDGISTWGHATRIYKNESIKEEPAVTEPKKPEEMAAFFDKRADGYDAHMAECFGLATYQKAVQPVKPDASPLRVLDIGCGTGIELRFLFEKLPNAKVTCVDLSEEMLKLLRKAYEERASQLEIFKASYLEFDFPENAYDYILAFNTLHHFEADVKTALYQKLRRALKPGGLYIEADYMVDERTMEDCLAKYRALTAYGADPGRYHIDIPFTVELQTKLLHGSGFSEVCVFDADIKEEGSNAILTAKK